jgi:hypothetical protein
MTTPQGEPDAAEEAQTNEGTFIAEVLVSAGPRKSAAEYREDLTNAELCEDCAGLCWVGEKLIFWLCDGGSNAKILPRLPLREGEEDTPPVFGFSARILAQDLGEAFVEHCCRLVCRGEKGYDFDLSETIFAHVARNWAQRLHTHITLCEAREIPLLATLPGVIHASGDVSRSVDWTTTLTGGVFSPKEQHLAVINYGASGALIATRPATIITPNMHHIELRAVFRPEEGVNIRIFASPKVDWTHCTDVAGFAVMSDGLKLGSGLQEQLQRLQHRQFDSLKELRTELLRGAEPTEDDKAVIFGRYI